VSEWGNPAWGNLRHRPREGGANPGN